MDRTKANPSLGLLLGLGTAAVLSILAVVLHLVDGPERFGSLTLWSAIGIYFAAGALGGPLLGLALPLTVHRAGATAVGGLTALAVYLPISTVVPAAATGWVGAAAVGAVVGFAVWKPVAVQTGEAGARPNPPEEALLVHLVLSDDEFGTEEERARIHALTDRLDAAISAAGVWEFDGDEFGAGGCTLYMYGPSANALWGVVEDLLRASPVTRGGTATKRYGGPGPQTPSERVDFEPS